MQHPEFASGQRPIETIALLLPNIEISTVTLTGERNPAVVDPMVGDQLFLRVAQLLEIRNYRVVDGRSLCPESVACSQSLELLNAFQGFTESPVYEDTAPSAPVFQHGAAASVVASHLGADAILLIQYEETRDTSARNIAKNLAAFVTLAAVSSAAAANGGTPGTAGPVSVADCDTQLHLVLIDGRSSEILWEKRLAVRGRIAVATFAEQGISSLRSRPPVTPSAPSSP
jgi:hypothetical protein